MTMSWLSYQKDDVIAHYHSTNVICIGKGTYPNVSITVEQLEDILKSENDDYDYHYQWKGELPSLFCVGEEEIIVNKTGNEIIITSIFFPYNKPLQDDDTNVNSFKTTTEELKEIYHACMTNFDVRI